MSKKIFREVLAPISNWCDIGYGIEVHVGEDFNFVKADQELFVRIFGSDGVPISTEVSILVKRVSDRVFVMDYPSCLVRNRKILQSEISFFYVLNETEKGVFVVKK